MAGPAAQSGLQVDAFGPYAIVRLPLARDQNAATIFDMTTITRLVLRGLVRIDNGTPDLKRQVGTFAAE